MGEIVGVSAADGGTLNSSEGIVMVADGDTSGGGRGGDVSDATRATMITTASRAITRPFSSQAMTSLTSQRFAHVGQQPGQGDDDGAHQQHAQHDGTHKASVALKRAQ